MEFSSDSPLFSGGDLRTWLQDRLHQAQNAIDRWPPDELLGTSDQDAVDKLMDEYGVERPVLLRDRIESFDVEQASVTGRDPFGDDITVRVALRKYAIPFSGDADIFALRPSSYSLALPRGRIEPSPDGLGGELILTFEYNWSEC